MNHPFDELTRSMAQSVTRRAALKKFGLGLAGMALACFGLANKARAGAGTGYCVVVSSPSGGESFLSGYCADCKGRSALSPDCHFGTPASATKFCSYGSGFPAALSSIHCRR